eukprot:GAHX01001922.1.p1 GENE.GAHX01001922.1~~GAHX01001922.1.p1  ORF type:complete len:225 (-),score=60.32 GAHX01001922.1:50-688(-)
MFKILTTTFLFLCYTQQFFGKDKTRTITSKVFFTVRIGKGGEKTIKLGLFGLDAPLTSANFLALSKGGLFKKIDGEYKELTYKGSKFHRVIKGFVLQGGDFVNHNGTGGASIFGDKFDDEKFINKHDNEGLLSMANGGPNTNGSQFFITLDKFPHLDGKHLVFGKVLEGMDVVKEIGDLGAYGGEPREEVVVVNCGEYSDNTEDGEEEDADL